jgi:general stress protein 26
MPTVNVTTLAEIEAEFLARVHGMVWGNVATVDRLNRPRSRVLHTIWEGGTGWTATRRHSFKARHLEDNPYVSLAYIADLLKPVYVDATAIWAEDLADKRRVWDLFASTPPPLGYDPVPIFQSPDHPDFGLLKFTPWRIKLADGTGQGTNYFWRREKGAK